MPTETTNFQKAETTAQASRAVEQQARTMMAAHMEALVRVRLFKDRMQERPVTFVSTKK